MTEGDGYRLGRVLIIAQIASFVAGQLHRRLPSRLVATATEDRLNDRPAHVGSAMI
jgi:hypothetical protein